MKKIKNNISKNINELYEIYFAKKPNKKMEFKITKKYIQKRGVDVTKGINQYYYNQVIDYFDSID